MRDVAHPAHSPALADRIVDLVDTGNTLKANGLVPLEHIADISSRLIVNKAAMKMKHTAVKAFVAAMAGAARSDSSFTGVACFLVPLARFGGR